MTIGIDPTIIHVGHIEIRWYGLIIGLAIAVLIGMLYREARRKDLPTQHIMSMATWAILGGIVGARLFHILDNLGYYTSHPGDLLSLQLGGLAVYGAVAGGFTAVLVYSLVKRLPMLKFLDAAVFGLPLAQFVGRFACTINGDAYGKPTSLPWAYTYTNPNSMVPQSLLGVPTHPTPLYEQVWVLLLFAAMWPLRKRLRSDGMLFLLYATWYALGRFVISMYRVNNVVLFGLNEAQVISIVVLVVFLPLMFYLVVRDRRRTVQVGIGA